MTTFRLLSRRLEAMPVGDLTKGWYGGGWLMLPEPIPAKYGDPRKPAKAGIERAHLLIRDAAHRRSEDFPAAFGELERHGTAKRPMFIRQSQAPGFYYWINEDLRVLAERLVLRKAVSPAAVWYVHTFGRECKQVLPSFTLIDVDGKLGAIVAPHAGPT
jgi:hypothetical protein